MIPKGRLRLVLLILSAFLVAVFAGWTLRRGASSTAPPRLEDLSRPRQIRPYHWQIPIALKHEYFNNREIHLLPTPGDSADAVRDLRIVKLLEESPIYEAGFRMNDRILKVNERSITTLSRALNLAHEIESSNKLTVEVEREGKVLDFRFDLEEPRSALPQ
jgi:hypothetical protein